MIKQHNLMKNNSQFKKMHSTVQLKPGRIRLSIILLLSAFAMQLAYAQEQASVQVIANSSKEKIMLRWAANTPLAWKKGNEYGYLIERYTISRGGNAVLPVESTMITSYAITPKPLAEWETLALADDNAAVIAQAIYGEDFDVQAGGSPDNILAVNDQLEQRFTFALMAAEQNYEAAKLAGWAYEDTSVKPGEKYLYKIKVATPPESAYTIAEGSVYASPEFTDELPQPLGFASIFADSSVMLNWNFNLLQQTYSSYILEKSEDGNSFQQVNGQPIFNAQDTPEGEQVSLFYNDSIPNNKTFHYRVKGITPFGEIGPSSDVASGMGKEVLDFTPHIARKRIPADKTVEIEWEFAQEGNKMINGFELRRANNAEGPYETVVANIPAENRKTQYTGLQRINYFTVVAMGKNGTQKPSFPAIVQPVDSIPPKPPVDLIGAIDTTGVVQLSWKANEELDLSGYRVFRSNSPNAEFLQLTVSPTRENAYTDTIAVKNLNANIYYKVMAVDQRYNPSELSEMLTLEKPDMIPPSPAVIKEYTTSEEGILLSWVNSSSDDVESHLIYRKDLASSESRWEQLAELPITENKTEYLDKAVEAGKSYSYTVMAKDKTGWESSPSGQLLATAPKKLFAESLTRFTGTADRELRLIRLVWKSDADNISEYLIYRAEGDAPLTLYKTIDASQNNYTDTNLIVSTIYTYAIQLVEKNGTQSQLKQIKVTY